jgi:biotin transport system substrate-specific component
MRIQDIVYIALFAALMAVLGLIPMISLGVIPVPITAQSLGPMLAGSILGSSSLIRSRPWWSALLRSVSGRG